MKFGIGFPTCREGTAYPVPYVRPEDFSGIAQRAEELGYYALWGNDHLTTPAAIRATQSAPPNFYEPLITFASLAAVTRRIRFMLGVVVLPEREIILLAKQLATLDQLSRGRLLLGVGIGSYREEFEAVHPELKGANRGRMMEEGIAAVRTLFSERRASFSGRYVNFEDVELAPKPYQQPFPILLNAHADIALERVGATGDGWIVAGLPVDRTAEARHIVDAAARNAGRDPGSIPLHYQVWLSFGTDRQSAFQKLQRSQHWRRTLALRPDVGEEDQLERFVAGNLVGSPEDVIQQIRSLQRQTRVDHLGVVMLGETTRELLEDMQLFAREVIPAFAGIFGGIRLHRARNALVNLVAQFNAHVLDRFEIANPVGAVTSPGHEVQAPIVCGEPDLDAVRTPGSTPDRGEVQEWFAGPPRWPALRISLVHPRVDTRLMRVRRTILSSSAS